MSTPPPPPVALCPLTHLLAPHPLQRPLHLLPGPLPTSPTLPSPKRAVNTHDTDPSHEQPPTDTPTGDPTPPESPADPDLDNNAPCEDFTFDDSTLEHIVDTYSPLTLSIKPTSIMSLNTPLLNRGPLLIGELMVALLVLM